MVINYGVSGSERQKLVRAIAKATGETPVYQKAPTFEYKVGSVTVTCDGKVVFEDGITAEEFYAVVDSIGFPIVDADCGAKDAKTGEWSFDIDQEEKDFSELHIVVGPSVTETQFAAIEKLVASKRTLILHSLGATAIDVELDGEGNTAFIVKPIIEDADLANAAMALFAGIVQHGRDAKRTPTKEKVAENEKYAFRCFLLRLGFVGDDTKEIRKTLMRNLSGSASFKNKGGAR